MLLVGPPGCGKTRLARQLPDLLPPLTEREALTITRIRSIAGLINNPTTLHSQRPFRAPHHSCSRAALLGGGVQAKPGELSLAHNGVLFLDELVDSLFIDSKHSHSLNPLQQNGVGIPLVFEIGMSSVGMA